jgi:hypothetical protein
VYTQDVVFLVGTWLSLVEHSLGVRGVGSSNLPVPTIKINHLQDYPACIRLVASSVPRANTVTPMLFASYTPGALVLFGLVASGFGCSGSVDTFYNVALAAAAIFLL